MFRYTLPIMLLGFALSWSTAAARPLHYGPVAQQDTLWAVATRLRPSNSVTIQQTMLALYHKNPQAFANNNINSLLKGARLRAPTVQEARRYKRIGALREARRHNRYWKRGVELPRIAPPPLPKLAKTAKPLSKSLVYRTDRQTARVAARPRRSSLLATLRPTTPTHPTAATLQAKQTITELRGQLKDAETKNQRLISELQALQAKQSQQGATPDIDIQVKKLKTELDELKTVLDQKDNHIKTLQASLKSASEAIKSQHDDNRRLYDKLKEVSPDSVPATPETASKPELKLSSVQEDNKKVADGKTADPLPVTATPTGAVPVWADQMQTQADSAQKSVIPDAIPLSQMVKHQQSPAVASNESGNKPYGGASPLALAIALISFLFIVALAWRALLQQREARRLAEREDQKAENLRKRLVENQARSTIPNSKEPATPIPASLNF